MHTELEKRAISFAAAELLIFSDESASFYDNYLLFVEAVKKNKTPGNCEIYQPYEHMDVIEALKLIDELSDNLLCQFEAILDEAKAGIVQCAIDGELDSDMNLLSMECMIKKGCVNELIHS